MSEKISYVYFIRAGKHGPIKIGKSVNPQMRMAELQTGNLRLLRIVGLIPNASFEVEQDLHRRFDKFGIRGEWYKPRLRILWYIRRNCEKW